MKKFLAIIIMICLLVLSGCETYTNKGVTVEQYDHTTQITLNNFQGKTKIKIDPNNEGSLYSKSNLTEGSVKVYCDPGFLWDKSILLDASADNNYIGSGGYIDSSVSVITIIIESKSGATGDIFISFREFKDI